MRASEIHRRLGGCRPMALGVRVATPSAGSSAALRFGSNRRAQQQQGGGVGRGLALRQASPSSSSSEAPAAVFGEGEAFEACLDFVSTLGPFSSEEAADMLKDAFGWSRQTYWRKRKSEEVPQLAAIEERVEALRGAGGLSDDQVAKVVAAFPEVLGCEADLLRENVAYVEKTFFVKGNTLTSLLVRKPEVLGNIVDCQGDCVGDCNRCWVRF
mmetsp:Transcript_35820/g.77931  ORF Transcript_35820/g.77931 Transcript_35820/m.77931 type:complete len:213 (-) Transcript_35820:75-713(-)